MKLFAIFRNPTHEELAAHQLQEAQRTLLEMQALQEQALAAVNANQSKITRLKKYLAEITKD